MFDRMQPAVPAPSPGARPASPMDFLIGRIAAQASYSSYVENETDHPIANGTVNAPRIHGTADSVAEIPLSRIMIYPGIASYDSVTPLITTDGAPIAATGSGPTWGQLYAAGRMA